LARSCCTCSFYTYVGDDPLDRTDPTGNDFRDVIQGSLPELVTIGDDFAGVAAFVVGKVSGNESLSNAAVEGLSASRATNVNLAISLALTTRSGEGEGVVYERTNTAAPGEKPYIGRSKSDDRYEERQQEHARDNPDANYKFKVVDRAEPGEPLRQAEQQQITARGGPTNRSNPNGGTSNKRNEIARSKTGPGAKPRCDPPTGSHIPSC
jgi:hypothetical protein